MLNDGVLSAESKFTKTEVRKIDNEMRKDQRGEHLTPCRARPVAVPQEFGSGPGLQLDLSQSFSGSIDSPTTLRLQQMALSTSSKNRTINTVRESPLSSSLKNLANLHAVILKTSPRLFITQEIGFVLTLLAADSNIRNNCISHEDEGYFKTGIEINSYAAAVLSRAPQILQVLTPKLQMEIQSYISNLMQQRCNEQILNLSKDLELLREKKKSPHFLQSPSFNHVQNRGTLSGHLGLGAFINDGIQARNSEERKRLTNREYFRDSWFNLMKDAVSKSSSLESDPTKQMLDNSNSDLIVLKVLQEQSGPLLRSLRRDNFRQFAELFTAAVLQAAATGETLIDKELKGLAERNLTKFQKLNERMHQQGGKKSVTKYDMNKKTTKTTRRNPNLPGHHKKLQVDYESEHAMQIASEFTKSLRPMVLFLEVSDSHRLDCCIVEVMKEKLNSLLSMASEREEQLGDGHVLGIDELVVASSTLSSFLGYLAFTKGTPSLTGSSQIHEMQLKGVYDGTHPLDVLGALESSIIESKAEDTEPGAIFLCMPWITRYLKFLFWTENISDMPYFKKTFSLLAHIRNHPYLIPDSPLFAGISGICLRSLLDELACTFSERMNLNFDLSEAEALSISSSLRSALHWGEY